MADQESKLSRTYDAMGFLSTCFLCSSTDIAGLCDAGGTTPDLRPACRDHVDPTTSAEAIIADLTEAQKGVIEIAVDRSSTHSGRGGYNVQTMRALERKGLVKQGKVHTWETDWLFTPAGHVIGARLHLARLTKNCREKATSELMAWFPNSRGQSSAAIMQELETRGWQWQPESTDWTRVHTPSWTIVEGTASTYHYHVRDASQPNASTLPSACDARVMSTQIPLSSWGVKDHLPSHWCVTCAARAEFPMKPTRS